MARIFIEPAKAKRALPKYSELERMLKGLYQEANGVRSGLNYRIGGQEAIRSRLNDAAQQLDKEAAGIRSLYLGLEQIIAQYEQTESGNLERVAAEKVSVQWAGAQAPDGSGREHTPNDWAIKIIKGIINPSTFSPESSCPAPSLLPPFLIPLSQSVLNSYVKSRTEGILDTKISDTKEFGKAFYYDPKTGEVISVDPKDEKFKKHNKNALPVDVRLASVGASRAISAGSVSGESSWGWGGASGSVDIAKLEGNASAYLGMLGVGASVGAGFTAFSAEEKAYLGTDNLQIYEKVGVSAGKVDGEAKIDVGLVDKKGNFNPSLYAGASAEALLGEVTGTVGAKVLGTDIGVKGSVNVGVGAHANVGFHDGKISVDVGASLGIGASLKLDIDVSGTVNAIGDFADKVGSGVRDALSWLNPWK